MKRLVWGAVLATGLWSEPLSQGERDRAMSHMHATRKQFLDAIAGLSEAQWNFKAAPERWSIAECAEHIAVSEDAIFQLAQQVLKSPAQPEKKAGQAAKDEVIIQRTPDRSTKVQAPEFLKPTRRWATRDVLVAHFKESRDRNIAWVQTTQEDLRAHFADHPVFKTLDAYQWLLLISAHSERHTLQIDEVKADPGYPKN
ncbi:MAG: DinB family protein [Acidobacteria bacterium]|nr:DinB family protein [Acidobacteriota bacterium]